MTHFIPFTTALFVGIVAFVECSYWAFLACTYLEEAILGLLSCEATKKQMTTFNDFVFVITHFYSVPSVAIMVTDIFMRVAFDTLYDMDDWGLAGVV